MISAPRIGLSADAFEICFPFHLAFTQQLRIRQFGRSLGRLLPTLRRGHALDQHFRLVRPAGPMVWQSLDAHRGLVILETVLGKHIVLRGQILHIPTEAVSVFVGSPWLTETAALDRLGLRLDDFAQHDSAVDQLHLIQAQRTALEESQELAARLNGQRAELRAVNESLLREVADRRKAEHELRQSEWRFRSVFESTQSALFVADHHMRITLVNPAWTHLLGRPAEQCLGRLLLEFLSFDRPPSVLALDNVSRDVADVLDCRLRTADGGEPRWAELRLRVLGEDDGTLSGVVGALTDITARREAEQTLLAAKAAAEQATELKSEFLANVSHEIRTPLNAVLGLAQLLGTTPLSDDQRQTVDTIVDSGRVLLGLLNDLLDLSKIEAGRLDLETVSFDPWSLIEDTLARHRAQAADKGLALFAVIGSAVPRGISGDPLRVGQVLANLITNAIKFTHRGQVVVTADWSDGRLLVGVADTGIGIADDARERLFTAFSQADGSTSRRFGGTGLGLSISRRLVEMMGGTITCESRPERGSTFRFTIAPGSVDSPAIAIPSAPMPVELRLASEALSLSISRQLEAWRVPFARVPIGVTPETGRPRITDVNGPNLGHVLRLDRGDAAAQGASPTRLLEFVMGLGKPHALENRPPSSERKRRRSGGVARPEVVRALVVEDLVVNQRVAAGLLELLGVQTTCVGSGSEALELLRRSEARTLPSLIFMDCQMPEMDGFEATVQIRALPGPPRLLPIVAMTASAMQGDRERCLACGMNDYLTKPLELEELARVVDRWSTRTVSGAPTPRADDASASAEDDSAMPVDLHQLAQLRGLPGEQDPTLLEEVVRLFLADAPRRLASLRDAVGAVDARRAAREAHALRGSASHFGARRFMELCSSLEGPGARRGPEAGAIVDRLDRELDRVRDALERSLIAPSI